MKIIYKDMNNFKIYWNVVLAGLKYVVSSDERKKNPVQTSVFEYLMKDKSRLPAGIVEGIYLGELNVTGLNYVESLSCDIGKYLKHQENMDDYIQLTRFISSDGMDRINCDIFIE